MKTELLFGIHCHQPIDNFDWVVYDAIKQSYKPFLQTLLKYPDIKIAIHYSGWLLEFIEHHDKELFELFKKLGNQLEWFSGGFYEPILASIPSIDRVAQIGKLNAYIQKHFNQTPKGLWLTERVWDESIIKDLYECGIAYAIVDDYHFIASGYDKSKLNGYYLTENGGVGLGLFPISQALRYQIPFGEVADVVASLETFRAKDGENAAIIFDDGEKFGVWPKTHKRVYEEGWLELFFDSMLADNRIVTVHFKDFFDKQKPLGLAYIPTVSYHEMGQWALSAEDAITLEALTRSVPQSEKFVKGGIWKNFLTKYYESNWIQKRSLSLSKKQLSTKAYKEALYKTQCNDTLWHGVFGGVYLPNLRDNAYTYIIECENQLYAKKKVKMELEDIDFDGYLEAKFHTDELIVIFDSKMGACIAELDIKSKRFNLLNTLTRYPEAYHQKIVFGKSESASDAITTIHDNTLTLDEGVVIAHDWYVKKSAIEHISDESFTLESFKNNTFTEYGDFANQNYEVLFANDKEIFFKRDGGIYQGAVQNSAVVEKSFGCDGNMVDMSLTLFSDCEEELKYIHEFNLHFMDVSQVTFNDESVGDEGLKLVGKMLVIQDALLGKTIQFEFEKPVDIYIVLIQSVSQSESGVDLTLQGVGLGFMSNFVGGLNFNYELTIR